MDFKLVIDVNKKTLKGGYHPEIKAVIFDGGGTIWDSSKNLYESYRWAFRQLGLSFHLSPEICHQLRGLRDFNSTMGIAKALIWASTTLDRRECASFLQGHPTNEFLVEKIKNLSKENPSFTVMATRLARLFDEYLYHKVSEKTCPLLPHARQLLEKLHGTGYKVAMVSIRPSISIKRILVYHGLDIYFSYIISTENFPGGGKGLDAAEEASKRLMIHPYHILWVGDSGADISCAKRAGMFAAGVLTGLANRQTFLDEGSDWVLDDIGGVANLLGIDH